MSDHSPADMLVCSTSTCAGLALRPVMDKLLALEQSHALLLDGLKTKLARVEGDVAFLVQAQTQQQQSSQQPQPATTAAAAAATIKAPAMVTSTMPMPTAPLSKAGSTLFGNAKSYTSDSMDEFLSSRPTSAKDVSHQAVQSEKEFQAMVKFANSQEDEQVRGSLQRPGCLRSLCPNVSRLFLEQAVDVVAVIMIVLNAIIMGVAVDLSFAEERHWLAVKCGFAIVFWMEIVVKLGLFGWRHQYFGHSAASNIFDSFLVLLDSVDIVLSFSDWSGGVPIMIFRTVRLLRVTRIFRIFTASVFNDFRAMGFALMSGSSTLLWSIVFFFCFIYSAGLLTRASFGPSPEDRGVVTTDPDSMQFYFQSVPRSIMTTYRCCVGDCTTVAGAPLLEFTNEDLGWAASLTMSALIFVASVAFFNIFGAVFVERIMAYAAEKEFCQQRESMNDKQLWRRKISKFIDLQLQLHEQVAYNSEDGEIEPASLQMPKQVGYTCLTKMTYDTLLKKSFSKEILDLSVESNEDAKQILAELHIEPQDCLKLSETLDGDKNGYIDVLELMTGLKSLRGRARRSDIVAVELAVQSMQIRMDEMWLEFKQHQTQNGHCAVHV